MAFGGSFKEDHPYATGLLLILVAGFGIAGSVTGQLASMLAALWVPSVLQQQGSSSSGGSGGIGGLISPLINPFDNPLGPLGPIARDLSNTVSTSPTTTGGPPSQQANVGITSGIGGTTA